MKKRGVKITSKPPAPKQSGLIRQTREWREAVAAMEAGKPIEIHLDGKLDGEMRSPVNAFLAALKRSFGTKEYKIYARGGVIYALPRGEKGEGHG